MDSDAADDPVSDCDGEPPAAGDTFGFADVTGVVDGNGVVVVCAVGDVTAGDVDVGGVGAVDDGVGVVEGADVRDCVIVPVDGVVVGADGMDVDGVVDGVVDVVSTPGPTFAPGWASRR